MDVNEYFGFKAARSESIPHIHFIKKQSSNQINIVCKHQTHEVLVSPTYKDDSKKIGSDIQQEEHIQTEVLDSIRSGESVFKVRRTFKIDIQLNHHWEFVVVHVRTFKMQHKCGEVCRILETHK